MTDARSIPVDPISADRLAVQALTYRTVELASDAEAEVFVRAVDRGFLDPEPADDALRVHREAYAERRNVGVYEEDAGDAWPIATVNSWVTPLTVPGGEIDMWAISSVTVAGTHRRRGIARSLLEGELRAAAGAGLAVAGLTASEATIYGRYGFAPAVPVADLTIDTRRAGWTGTTPAGRVEYVDKETLARDLGTVHERARRGRAGEVAGWSQRWRRSAGLVPGHDKPAAVRGVRWLDRDGVVGGAMAYTLVDVPGTSRAELVIELLTAAELGALVALWRFALQHDLVISVTARLRPVDDPIHWLVADQRAIETRVHDHGWLRVLDVPAALRARTYRAPLDAVVQVGDELGIAGGCWRISVGADGRADVAETDAAPDLTMTVAELSAVYVGGVTATQLYAAGRVQGSADAARRLDDAFRAAEAPLLSIWY